MTQVLILEDDASARQGLAEILRQEGYEVSEAASAAAARALLASHAPAALVADLVLEETRPRELAGLEVALAALRAHPDLVVLVVTAHGSVESAVRAVREGVYDYLEKPIDIERFLATLRRGLAEAARRRGPAAEPPGGGPALVGCSPLFKEARREALKAAGRDVTVLLLGETGTGKGVFAQAIHAASPRRDGPFVELPLVALPEDVAESELFGYERGAFTGADRAGKRGRLELAQGGTLFLDEIGEISPRLQLKLLGVLQNRRFVRVGGEREIELDARIIVATSRDLAAAVRSRAFREELYYRIAVYPIRLPPLRDRPEDIELLADHFLHLYADRHRTGRRRLAPAAVERLRTLPWPGNVRELEHAIERAVVAAEGEEIGAELFAVWPAGAEPASAELAAPASLRGRLDREEAEALAAALARAGGSRAAAARALGISLRTLFYKIKKYRLGGT